MSRTTALLSRVRSPRALSGVVLAVAIWCLAFLPASFSSAELTGPQPADRHITRQIAGLMGREHLTRHPLDDEISSRWLTNYLKMLDPRKVFFSQKDVDNYMVYRTQLDDMAAKGDTSFAYRVFNDLLTRIDERVKMVDELLPLPQDYSIDEDMQLDPDQMSWAKDGNEMRDRWRKRIKYELLDLASEKSLEGKEAQEKISKRYHHLAKRMKQTDSDELLEMYLTSLTTAYDPHTSFMSASTLENFEIQMKLNLEGIGAALEAPDGETVVKKVIPGGPASKDGRLKPEDRITGVGQGEDGAIVNVGDMKLNDVVKLIRGHQGTTVRLAVIPKGETDTHIYNLVRQQIELTDSEAQSIVFPVGKKADGTPFKVGFINLPSFYMDMTGARNGREDFKSTTRDVAKLLKKFNQDKVDAVVIDLRKNGGGSLTESINLTGLFIDTGPVVQVKDYDGQKTQYDDTDRGVAWAGPLVVLTSKYSASASEIFAGAIQDYHRGLIVGDPSTHGKGTVQSLLDLSQKIFHNTRNAPQLGALKITMQQFYRPDGDSTQNRGVLADVDLPSFSSHSDMGEATLPFAMKFDHVNPVPYRKLNLVDNGMIEQLKTLSAERRKENKDFQKLDRELARYDELQAKKRISLNKEKFLAERAEMTAEKAEEKELEEMNATDRPVVKRDFYVDEVLAITADYVRALEKFQAASVGKR